MGFLVTKRQNTAGDKTVSPQPRVHGTSFTPAPSGTDRTRKGNGRAFHKPKQTGTQRPFGPQ
jgi:hypothetical protein